MDTLILDIKLKMEHIIHQDIRPFLEDNLR